MRPTCDENKRKREKEEAEAVQDEATDTSKVDVEGSNGSNDSPSIQEEMRQDTPTYIVLQKNMRSTNLSEWLDELFREVYRVRCDVMLISETWRQIRNVHQQTWSRDTVEKTMEKSDQLGPVARLKEWLQHRFRSTNNR